MLETLGAGVYRLVMGRVFEGIDGPQPPLLLCFALFLCKLILSSISLQNILGVNTCPTCVHVCEHMSVQLCLHVCGEEVDTRCLPQLLSLFTGEGSLTEPRAPQFG